MRRARPLSAFAVLLLACPGPASAQDRDLVIEAPGARTTLSLHDLAALPRDTARVRFRDSTTFLYEGVPLAAVLRRVGVHADSLRGRTAAARRVVLEAPDGYRVVLSLAEVDPAGGAPRALLADRVDGAALPTEEGPVRLVMGGDPRHSRWIRNVTRIRVLDEAP